MHLVNEERPTLRDATPVHPGASALRRAIQRNLVSFPAQIPVFLKHPPADMQWRVILLFFIRGWSSANIARRFEVPVHQIWQVVNDWSIRALALGFVQVVDEDEFAACCRLDTTPWPVQTAEEVAGAEPKLIYDQISNLLEKQAVRTDQKVEEKPDLLTALDIAIAHCENWEEPFWAHAATLLRDMKTVAAAIVDANAAGPRNSQHTVEPISHAVA